MNDINEERALEEEAMTFLLEEEREKAELQNALMRLLKQKYLQDLRLGQHETTIKINTHIHMYMYTCADR